MLLVEEPSTGRDALDRADNRSAVGCRVLTTDATSSRPVDSRDAVPLPPSDSPRSDGSPVGAGSPPTTRTRHHLGRARASPRLRLRCRWCTFDGTLDHAVNAAVRSAAPPCPPGPAPVVSQVRPVAGRSGPHPSPDLRCGAVVLLRRLSEERPHAAGQSPRCPPRHRDLERARRLPIPRARVHTSPDLWPRPLARTALRLRQTGLRLLRARWTPGHGIQAAGGRRQARHGHRIPAGRRRHPDRPDPPGDRGPHPGHPTQPESVRHHRHQCHHRGSRRRPAAARGDPLVRHVEPEPGSGPDGAPARRAAWRPGTNGWSRLRRRSCRG